VRERDDDAAPLSVTPGRTRIIEAWADPLGRTAIRALQILILAALAAVAIFVAHQLWLVVIPVIIAVILAAAFSPLVEWLRRRRVPNALAALLTLLLAVVVLLGVLTGVTLAVINQWGTLVNSAADGVDTVQRFVGSSGFPVDQKQVAAARKSVVSFLTSGTFASGALAGVSTATTLVTGLVLVIFVLFFLLKDGGAIWRFLVRPLHAAGRVRAERIGHRSLGVLGAYVRGTALVALIDAVFIGAGLFILRVPLALPLTVLVFVTAFIPVVGATLSGIVSALVALVTGGPVEALIVIGIVVLVNQIEGNVLQPLIMGKALSLHPLAILLALTAGTVLAGVIGAVLAVPAASVIWTAIKARDD
jgi:predicted PurR-regulated permease PerM